MQTFKSKLTIHLNLWMKLIETLRKKGEGKRESGAFLLGQVDTNVITAFISYDDLDPSAFDSGIITFEGRAYIKLWKLCSEKKLMVLADVHTHPYDWTGQSSSDKYHPMIAQKGHIALIVPRYSQNKQTTLKGIGVHEYLGAYKWRSWKKHSKILKIISNEKGDK